MAGVLARLRLDADVVMICHRYGRHQILQILGQMLCSLRPVVVMVEGAM
jgi:hypothetical protein